MKLSQAVLMLLLAALPVPMYAGSDPGPGGGNDPFVLNFDEQGVGTINVNGTGFITIWGATMIDPISGMQALAYKLPEPVVTGDVGVFEEGSHKRPFSDGLRFEQIGNNFYMFYFSDPGDGDLADTGLPHPFKPHGNLTQEIGEEGDDGFTWLPGGNEYHGVSDTPEIDPSSAMSALALLSGMLLVVRGCRKQAKPI